jgi:hypothetical protein
MEMQNDSDCPLWIGLDRLGLGSLGTLIYGGWVLIWGLFYPIIRKKTNFF